MSQIWTNERLGMAHRKYNTFRTEKSTFYNHDFATQKRAFKNICENGSKIISVVAKDKLESCVLEEEDDDDRRRRYV